MFWSGSCRRVTRMSEVTITVRGEHETRVTPERATAFVTVRVEGSERQPVIDDLLRFAEPVRSGLMARADAHTLVEWSSSSMSVRAERPWNPEGKRLAPIHHASIEFRATFSDVSELSLWATDVSVLEGVQMGGVQWALTPETRSKAERDVATHAVSIAVERAQAYASALGLRSVTPLEIADTGLISRQESPRSHRAVAMMARGAVSDAAPAMEFEPEEIVVSSTVEARFSAH